MEEFSIDTYREKVNDGTASGAEVQKTETPNEPLAFDSEIAIAVAGTNASTRFWILLLGDILVIVAGFWFAIISGSGVREILGLPPQTIILPASGLVAFAIFGLPIILIIGKSYLAGHYTNPKTAWCELRDLLLIGFNAICLISIVIFLSKGHYSRLHVGIFWIFVLTALPFCRWLMKLTLMRFGKWFVPVAIIGSGANSERCSELIENDPMLGYSVMNPESPSAGGFSILFAPDTVDEFNQMKDTVESTLRNRESIIVSPPFFGLALQGAEIIETLKSDSILIKLHNNLKNSHYIYAKRIFDVLFSCLALILFSPIVVVFYILIKLDGGPFLYKQSRIGRKGELFHCWKMRSMVVDSDSRLESYLAGNEEARKEWRATFKLKNDPRVTVVGKLIRKFSVDELPQLWNVLRGDMSLVGPRPIVVEERSYYGKSYAYYTESLPGLTGLWQISGRNDTEYADRVELDVYYSRNWSLWLDMYIILKTIPILINRSGAY